MSLSRKPMKRSQPPRLWVDALEKVRSEGCCRVCKITPNLYQYDQDIYGVKPWHEGVYDQPLCGLEAAHVLGRKYDPVVTGPRGGKYRYVDPDSIVPLCWHCHQQFDNRLLSLIGYLNMSELRNAIKAVGKHRARRRLGGKRA